MKKSYLTILITMMVLSYINLRAGDNNSKTASPAAKSAISGVISDKSSSETLAGVSIRIVESDKKVYTDSHGEFSIVGLEPGTYQVNVDCISYCNKTLTLKVIKGKTEKISIQLNPIEP